MYMAFSGDFGVYFCIRVVCRRQDDVDVTIKSTDVSMAFGGGNQDVKAAWSGWRRYGTALPRL